MKNNKFMDDFKNEVSQVSRSNQLLSSMSVSNEKDTNTEDVISNFKVLETIAGGAPREIKVPNFDDFINVSFEIIKEGLKAKGLTSFNIKELGLFGKMGLPKNVRVEQYHTEDSFIYFEDSDNIQIKTKLLVDLIEKFPDKNVLQIPQIQQHEVNILFKGKKEGQVKAKTVSLETMFLTKYELSALKQLRFVTEALVISDKDNKVYIVFKIDRNLYTNMKGN